MSNDIIASHRPCHAVVLPSIMLLRNVPIVVGQSSAENVYARCLVTYILHLHAFRHRCFSAASYMMIIRMQITQRKEKMKYL